MPDQIDIIFQSIEYIESHLQSEITVAEIAEVTGYSLFHFIRTFDRIVHHTPYDYLMRRRLSEAAQILTTSDRRIIDISQDFCFNNQENFSRAFKHLFGVQPSQWRDQKMKMASQGMPPKTIADLRFINQNTFQYPTIETLDETLICGLMTALDGDDKIQQKQRTRCFKDLCEANTCPPAQFVSITSYIDRDCSKVYYFVGLEKKDLMAEGPTWVMYRLPAGKYAKVSAVEGERRLALNYLYFSWFPKTGHKPAGPMEIEFCSSIPQPSAIKNIYIPLAIDENLTRRVRSKS